MAEYEINDGVLIIPEGTKAIEENAFMGKSDFRSVIIPSTVTEIGSEAFAASNVSKIEIPFSVTKIGAGAFMECSHLESVILPPSLTEINGLLFQWCFKLKNVVIPETVTNIDNWAFQGCSELKSINIPETVTNIGCEAFDGCSELKSIIIPETVTSIGARTFRGCSGLKSISIPPKVIIIQEGTFDGCENINSIDIPSSVWGIDEFAFGSCLALESVRFHSKAEVVGMTAFDGCEKLKSIIVPAGTAEHFKTVFPEKLHALITEGDYEAEELPAHHCEKVDVSKYSEYATVDRYTIGLFEDSWAVEVAINGEIAECAVYTILAKNIAPLVGISVAEDWDNNDLAKRIIKKSKKIGKGCKATKEKIHKFRVEIETRGVHMLELGAISPETAELPWETLCETPCVTINDETVASTEYIYNWGLYPTAADLPFTMTVYDEKDDVIYSCENIEELHFVDVLEDDFEELFDYDPTEKQQKFIKKCTTLANKELKKYSNGLYLAHMHFMKWQNMTFYVKDTEFNPDKLFFIANHSCNIETDQDDFYPTDESHIAYDSSFVTLEEDEWGETGLWGEEYGYDTYVLERNNNFWDTVRDENEDRDEE